MPWRVRPFRYSTAELADYRTKTEKAVLSLALVIILGAPGMLAVSLWLLSRGESLSVGGVALEPWLAGIIAFGILVILSAWLIYCRNRPKKRNPPRTEPVPFQERWPLIQWWAFDINRWTSRRIPTSRWGSIAFAVLCAVFALGMAWLLITGHPDDPGLASWKLWLMLFICLYGIFHTTWLRQLRRRWGDLQPPRWSPESRGGWPGPADPD